MFHKDTYPAIDQTLRNFLALVLLSVVIIGITAALGTSFEIVDLPMAATVELEWEEVYDVLMISVRGIPWEGVWIE